MINPKAHLFFSANSSNASQVMGGICNQTSFMKSCSKIGHVLFSDGKRFILQNGDFQSLQPILRNGKKDLRIHRDYKNRVHLQRL